MFKLDSYAERHAANWNSNLFAVGALICAGVLLGVPFDVYEHNTDAVLAASVTGGVLFLGFASFFDRLVHDYDYPKFKL